MIKLTAKEFNEAINKMDALCEKGREQVKNLIVNDLKLVEVEEEPGLWEPELGQSYYYISSNAKPNKTNHAGLWADKNLIKAYNTFPNKTLAEKQAKRIKVMNWLAKAAHHLNEGWEPDWSNYCQSKYFIHRFQGGFVTDSFTHTRWAKYHTNVGTPAFKNHEIAEKAIGMMPEDVMAAWLEI